MINELDIKITIDDRDHVFSGSFLCEKNGCVNLEIESVNIKINFIENKEVEGDASKTKLTTIDNILEVKCENHNSYSPLSRGLVKPIKAFTKDDTQYYMQFTSSIFSKESNCREVNIFITKDN